MFSDRQKEKISVMLNTARILSTLGTCERGKHGAVITTLNFRIVGTGYTGAPAGMGHCSCKDQKRCFHTIHAEMNAILHLQDHDGDKVLFCTANPCLNCLKHLKVKNVKQIYFISQYSFPQEELEEYELYAREFDIYMVLFDGVKILPIKQTNYLGFSRGDV